MLCTNRSSTIDCIFQNFLELMSYQSVYKATELPYLSLRIKNYYLVL